MIELKHDELVFSFPEVHDDAICSIDFQRTLRIPDDNRSYPLPPGLGRFPMEHTDDHSDSLPVKWKEHGGVLLPMYQAEALWINFNSDYPFAVKIATGKINAVTGKEWSNKLTRNPQDYLVIPDQPWLDGYCVQKGLIRQFVAMPLGEGYTAEEQISGKAEHGGLQIIVYPMKRKHYELMQREESRMADSVLCQMKVFEDSDAMGLAPGGLMRQEIYEDEHDFNVWDTENSSRCFVHILNSKQWKAVTGNEVPGEPPGSKEYTEAGLPWFEYYDDHHQALTGAKTLAGMDSVAAKTIKQGKQPKDNDQVSPENVSAVGPSANQVKEGKW